MRDVVRVNTRGRGYGQLGLDEDGAVVRFPLGADHPDGPAGSARCQDRLDDLLDRHPDRPYFIGSAGSDGEQVLLAYAVMFPVEDEHGRRGVSFHHARQVDRARLVESVVDIGRLLYGAGIGELAAWVAGLANGERRESEFFDWLALWFSHTEPRRVLENVPSLPEVPIGGIEHDCGGAVVAWTAMVQSHAALGCAWEVFDDYGANQRLVTRSSVSDGRSVQLLSRCIADLSGAYAVLLWTREVVGKLVSGPVLPHLGADPPRESDKASRPPRPEGAPQPSPTPRSGRRPPPPGEVVVLGANAWDGHELTLKRYDGEVRVTRHNVEAAGEHDDFFYFVIKRMIVGVFPAARVRLLLFRSGLSEQWCDLIRHEVITMARG